MRVLITGSSGFIGSSTSIRLLKVGYEVIGIDNNNDYYDINLKIARQKNCQKFKNFKFYKTDICDKDALDNIFLKTKPDIVVNLAAQAGVRYSIDNPFPYIHSNILGFTNILECCRNHKVNHLIYASTSSVYGANTKLPYSINDNVNHPLSLYAATKLANESMAHSYSYLFSLPTTGLRFFTVYGPWGRPDMALFKFTKAILSDQKIDLFNYGNHKRDFTYIDDITKSIELLLDIPPQENKSWNAFQPNPGSSLAPWRILNIGNNAPIELKKYISLLEMNLSKKAKINKLPLQLGDIPNTFADIKELVDLTKFTPSTPIDIGIKKFVNWYIKFYC